MSPVNRRVLGVLGALLLVAGVLVVMINTELLGWLLRTAGTGRIQPDARAGIVPAAELSVGEPSVLVLLAVAGVLVAALAVWWLLANLPRRIQPTPLRLHQDPQTGTTVVDPAALNAAIAYEVEQLPGAITATALVQGAVRAPHLAVRVTVDERADVAGVVRAISSDVAGGLALALDTTIEQVAVLVDIDRKKLTATQATL